MKKNYYSLIILSLLATSIVAQTTNQLTQYGITWTFSTPKQYGQFANGDYWVIGPVTITSITPDYTNGYNGWEVNPSDINKQGFDKRIYDFDATKIPALPYTASGGQSIVKTISIDAAAAITSNTQCLKTAAVLTVLSSVPPDNGATVFRPPYFSTNKPLYSTKSIDTTLLPSLPPVANMPTLTAVNNNFKRVQLDHKYEWPVIMMHPEDNMPGYGSIVASRNAEGALRLMMNDPLSAKMPALISYIQYGIDLFQIAAGGGSWKPNGGHAEGRKLPIAFAGWILHNQVMRDTVKLASNIKFGENGGVYYSPKAGKALFGQQGLNPSTEYAYWNNQVTDNGGRTIPDPYGYIDGGETPGGEYQFCCLSQPWKGNTLPAFILPDVKDIWNNQTHLDYVDRWVNFGAWTQADPCAPHDGNWANYGITYGPDGHGGCIVDNNPADGIGRYPNLHGTAKDGGNYESVFVNNMWNQYRQYGNPITFSSSANTTICVGQSTQFKLSGINTSKCSISWNGGSYATDTSYITSPITTTTVTAVIKYKNGLGSTASHNFVVKVNPLPVLIVSSAIICMGDLASLSASGSGNYIWTSSHTLSASTGSKITLAPISSLSVSVSSTNSCGTTNKMASVTVNTSPVFVVSDAVVCMGDQASLSAFGSENYSWTSSEALSSSTGSKITLTPINNLSVSVSSTNGCGTTNKMAYVTVNHLPVVTVSSTIVCMGNQASLSASGSENYVWTSSEILSSSTGSVITLTPDSTSSVFVSSTNACGTVSRMASITVNNLPVISIIGETTACSGSSVSLLAMGGISYAWTSNGTLNNQTGSEVIATDVTETNTISVIGMDAKDCYASTAHIITLDLCEPSGINQDLTERSFSVFPNPTNGIIYIQIQNASSAIVEIYNTLGDKIYQEKTMTTKSKIDLSEQAKGIYFYKIISQENSNSGKIIIQ